MFFSFLNNSNKAAHASPSFDVIMIGTAIAGVYPDMLTGLVDSSLSGIVSKTSGCYKLLVDTI